MNEHHPLPDKYDFYLKLIETTLNNAEQFQKDALLLRSNLSFGHAYSLAILGFEELAKCWFAFGLFIGTYLETDVLVSGITSDHQVKQELGWQTLAYIILSEWFENTGYKAEINELAKQLRKKEISLESYTRRFYRFAEQESKSLEIAQSVVELTLVLEKLEDDKKYLIKRKNEGLYVDFDLSQRRITSSPDKFILDNVVFIETFDGFCRYTKEFIKEIKNNLKRKTIKEAIDNVRKSLDFIREQLERDE